MAAVAIAHRRALLPSGAAGVGWILVLSVVAALAVAVVGPVALLVPVIVVAAILAALYPATFALVLLGVGITFEQRAIDFTGPIGANLWSLPDGISQAAPLTISPVEICLIVVTASLVLRRHREAPPSSRVPLLFYAVPFVIMLGFIQGARLGGPMNLGYNEARGLLYGMVLFVLAMRFPAGNIGRLYVVVFAASTGLAVINLLRWWFYTRSGNSEVPLEFAFAHENAVLFGIAVLVSSMRLLKAKTNRDRALLILHILLVLAATMATGRRSATLVLIIGGLSAAWLLFPKRPGAVIAAAVPILLLGGAYLAVYWNHEYGAIAQPARAIRSQISPSARDESSDSYRDIENENVRRTLAENRLFGVGFGNPYARYRPLPSLLDFWSLQYHTPHQNVLWLWLKMGLAGIAVFIGVWLMAFRRCMIAIRSVPRHAPLPTAPMTLAVILLMYLAYAQVDQALTSTRSIGALVITVALCFRLPAPERSES